MCEVKDRIIGKLQSSKKNQRKDGLLKILYDLIY
jgi:hypothetical protein